jgi:hypothetical protein
MAQALVEGWNPVLNGTVEGLKSTLTGICNFDHILCAPKVTAIASAVVSKGTNLFTATMFLPCCLFIALFSVIFRFAVEEYRCSKFVATLLAVCILLPVELLNYVMYGTVDSVKYASTLASIFSFLLWVKNKRGNAAVMFCMCLSVCAVSKTAGIGIWLILGLLVLFMGRRQQLIRNLAIYSFLFVMIVGASPYITQWIHGGSPFYPSHSFDKNRSTKDLTGDFISSRNADALEMGALGRVVYAWFSQDLAKKGTKWYLEKDEYKPVFGWPSANGYGKKFAFYMSLSLCLLPFIKHKMTLFFFLLVFLIDNLAPSKYLGFYRYFPEMYAIPFVTFMGFAYSPRFSYKIPQKVISLIWNLILWWIAFVTIRHVVQWYDLTISMEKLRQDQYQRILKKSDVVTVKGILHRIFEPVAYRRLMAAGLKPVSASEECKKLDVYFTDNYNWFRTMVPGLTKLEADRLVNEMHNKKLIKRGFVENLISTGEDSFVYVYGGVGWPTLLFQPPEKELRKFKKEMKK